mmetsp:Transcript_9428/g.27851  ORF Transcript_9428/g.27851 Transcript_9428/m.27851 type:complete len:375 (+) Transcript_9428:178-1302(+)
MENGPPLEAHRVSSAALGCEMSRANPVTAAEQAVLQDLAPRPRRQRASLLLRRRGPVVDGPELGRPDGLGGQWKRNSLAVPEDHGLVLLWHCRVHHWAVPVPLDVLIQALVRVRPRDLADLGTVKEPPREALKGLHEAQRVLMGQEVDKCVAKINAIPKVHGQVDEVIICLELVLIQESQQHPLSIPVRNVPEHNRGLGPRGGPLGRGRGSPRSGRWNSARRLRLCGCCSCSPSAPARRLLGRRAPAVGTVAALSTLLSLAAPAGGAPGLRLHGHDRGHRERRREAPRHACESRERRRRASTHSWVAPGRERPREAGERRPQAAGRAGGLQQRRCSFATQPNVRRLLYQSTEMNRVISWRVARLCIHRVGHLPR